MRAVLAVRVPHASRRARGADRRQRWRRPPTGGRGPTGAPAGSDRSLAAWMTPLVACVDELAPLAAVRALVLETGRAVPVVAADGWLLGIVTRTDLIRTADVAGADERDRGPTAGDVMSAFVFTLPPAASIARAAALMAYEGIGQLVVVDDDRRIAGLITATDVARALARAAGYVV
jgi:CBS domain-containing protein